MKRRPTNTEWLLRKAFRQDKLTVQNQKVLGYYIFDFCIPKIKVLIEVNGGYHNIPQQKEKDKEKQKFGEKCGYHIFVVSDEEVKQDPKLVVKRIKIFAISYGIRKKHFFRVRK